MKKTTTLLRCGFFYFVGTSKMLALALRVNSARASWGFFLLCGYEQDARTSDAC
jgi:hypothetical protein